MRLGIFQQPRLAQFRACIGQLTETAEGVTLDEETAAVMGVGVGDTVTYAPA